MTSTETHLSPPSPQQANPATGVPRDLRWTVWPLRDRFSLLWWTPLAPIAVGFLVGWRLGSQATGYGAAIAMAVTLLPQWAPVTYQFADEGLVVGCFGRRRLLPWTRVRAVRARSDGATLFAHSIGAAGKKEWSSVRITFPPADDSACGELRRRVKAARKITAA